MEKMPLADYAKQNGQAKTAQELNLSQGAISKAIATNRKIFVFKKDGKLQAEETRPFPYLRANGLPQSWGRKNPLREQGEN